MNHTIKFEKDEVFSIDYATDELKRAFIDKRFMLKVTTDDLTEILTSFSPFLSPLSQDQTPTHGNELLIGDDFHQFVTFLQQIHDCFQEGTGGSEANHKTAIVDKFIQDTQDKFGTVDAKCFVRSYYTTLAAVMCHIMPMKEGLGEMLMLRATLNWFQRRGFFENDTFEFPQTWLRYPPDNEGLIAIRFKQ